MINALYALVTPARNEGLYIKQTIECVIAQTLKPVRWIIVSDGSTDDTDKIIGEFAAAHSFIHLLRLDRDGGRTFAAKVHAINAAIAQLDGVKFDFLGNLDADIVTEPNYFETLLARMQADAQLGMAGGIIYEYIDGKRFKPVQWSHSVAGAVQMFRRECFESIGGYRAIATGGIDTVAEVTARMRGWRTYSFSDLETYHLRREGTAERSRLGSYFHAGYRDCMFGHHFLFQVAKCLRRVHEQPIILSSSARLLGYVVAAVNLLRGERPVSREFVSYLRREQTQRLRGAIPRLRVRS